MVAQCATTTELAVLTAAITSCLKSDGRYQDIWGFAPQSDSKEHLMSTAAISSNVHSTAAPKTQSAAAPAKSPSAPPAARSSASVASAGVPARAAALKEVPRPGT